MTELEFKRIFQRVIDDFDPKNSRGERKFNVYGQERCRAIFETFKGMTPEQFKRVVDRAFKTERVPPLAKDLERIADELRVQDHLDTKQNLLTLKDLYQSTPEEVRSNVTSIVEMLQRKRRFSFDDGNEPA